MDVIDISSSDSENAGGGNGESSDDADLRDLAADFSSGGEEVDGLPASHAYQDGGVTSSGNGVLPTAGYPGHSSRDHAAMESGWIDHTGNTGNRYFPHSPQPGFLNHVNRDYGTVENSGSVIARDSAQMVHAGNTGRRELPFSIQRGGPSHVTRDYGAMASSGPQLNALKSSASPESSAWMEHSSNAGDLDSLHGEPSKAASLSQPPGRRILPSSVQPGVSRNAMHHGSRGKFREFHKVPLKPKSNGNDSGDSEDEVFVYETNDSRGPGGNHGMGSNFKGKVVVGSSASMGGMGTGGELGGQNQSLIPGHRVLPAWMSDQGRYSMNSHYPGINDGREYPGVGEPVPKGVDEALVYEAVLQDLAQPKVELEIENGLLAVTLLRHQKIALAWMERKERTSRPCSGGILADDQGLGKTVSMIALILKQMPLQRKFTSSQSINTKTEMLNLDEDENLQLLDTKSEVLHMGDNGTSKSADTKPEILKVGNDGNPVSQVSQEDYAKDHHKLTRASNSSGALKGKPAAGTLVVCPASILRQWARELDEKVASGAKLSVKIYHGSSRTKHPSELAKYDVVLTTYAIITNEVPKQSLVDDDGDTRNSEDYGLTSDFSNYRKRKGVPRADNKKKKKKKGKGIDLDDCGAGPLSKVRWFRVILDEAQVIKNHRTQVARACCGLRAKTRWCLSGTPLQNAVDDLYSYFRFLKYDPYAKYSSFCSALKHPIYKEAVTGYKKLQAVLRAVMLRRTKDTKLDGEPILKLPPKKILLKKLCFSVEERSFYAGLEANFRDRFKAYAAEGTVKQNYANILIMLLRLRQACDHPSLVKDYDSDSSAKTSIENAKTLPKEKIIYLLKKLDSSSATCVLCDDTADDPVVAMCGHVFCYQCVSESITGEGNLCPASGCHFLLDTNYLFSRGTLRCCIPDEPSSTSTLTMLNLGESPVLGEGFVSSKIKAALKILVALQSRNSTSYADCPGQSDGIGSTSGNVADGPYCGGSANQPRAELPQKAIIFSQWTGMLDLLEISLNLSLIPYRRLDGSMSLASRDSAVKDFNSDPEVTVMIMSLKSGNLGLNMVAACHVILLDLWWNPTSEDQAIDRAHRIGQARPVFVHRLTIEDTVEARILALQEKKREMVSSAFGEDSSGKKAATRLTMEDLRYLFQV